jgi:hypothetical protein
MQRAGSQCINPNLTNQRRGNVGEVVVGTSRCRRKRLGTLCRSRMLRQDFQGKLLQRRVSEGRHIVEDVRVSVGPVPTSSGLVEH